jgi:hypothetical protein
VWATRMTGAVHIGSWWWWGGDLFLHLQYFDFEMYSFTVEY